MSELEDFKAQLDAKPVAEVRESAIFLMMMANMLDREDATYMVDEMVAGDMSTVELSLEARATIERIARG